MVVLDHAGDEGMRLFEGADVNRVGRYGVYLFFVLSAFLLTFPFLSRSAEELRSPLTWANYFLRRFLRIFPLYAVVLVFFTLTGELDWSQLRDHLLLREGRWHFWTIPVEFKFYFVLPVVALVFVFLSRKAWVSAIATGAVLGLGLEWVLFPIEEAWSLERGLRLGRTIETFLLGSAAGAIYWCLIRRPAPRRLKPWFEAVSILCLVTMLLRVPAIYEVVIPNAGNVKSFDDDHIFCGIVWSLFLVSYLNGTGMIRGALEWAPLCYLGLISYSAYLWHRGVLKFVDDLHVPPIAQLFISLALVIAVATVTYLLIERPSSRIRLTPKRHPVRSPGADYSTAGQQRLEPFQQEDKLSVSKK